MTGGRPQQPPAFLHLTKDSLHSLKQFSKKLVSDHTIPNFINSATYDMICLSGRCQELTIKNLSLPITTALQDIDSLGPHDFNSSKCNGLAVPNCQLKIHNMGSHKFILALALAMIVAGNLTAEAVFQEEPLEQKSPKGSPSDHDVPSSVSGDRQWSAAGASVDKAIIAPKGYFHPPILPPCGRKTC